MTSEMGVVDVSSAIERFADKMQALVPPCQDPERDIRHQVHIGVKKAGQRRKE